MVKRCRLLGWVSGLLEVVEELGEGNDACTGHGGESTWSWSVLYNYNRQVGSLVGTESSRRLRSELAAA